MVQYRTSFTAATSFISHSLHLISFSSSELVVSATFSDSAIFNPASFKASSSLVNNLTFQKKRTKHTTHAILLSYDYSDYCPKVKNISATESIILKTQYLYLLGIQFKKLNTSDKLSAVVDNT